MIDLYPLLLGLAAVLAFLAYGLLRSSKAERTAESELFEKFGVSTETHRLLSSDLGGKKPKIFLANQHVTGVSDAIFQERQTRAILIGEFKGRYYRGRVRPYERFQVILYMGLAMGRFRTQNVSAVLAYRDARIRIDYDPRLFRWLLSLVPELTRLEAKFAKR